MSSAAQTEVPLSPAVIFDILNAHQRTAALKAAVDLDVFRAVGEGPGDVASIARQCSASERGIRILCDFLCISGLLSKDNGQYKHTPVSAAFLDPRSPTSVASITQFLCNPMIHEPYQHLAEIVRNGRTVLPGDGSVEPDNPVWVDFAESMVPLAGPSAVPLADSVLEGRTGPMQVLDIAAGHGIFGITVAKINPEAQITALDSPKVLEVAQRNAAKMGVADRHKLLPGSAFEVEFGGPYDAVLLTNFLHHFDPPTCVGLLKKIHEAMKPGARLATLEFVPNEDRISPPMPAGFSMTMLTSTPAGDAYTLSQLSAMYKEAGFKQITSRQLPAVPQTIVIGEA